MVRVSETERLDSSCWAPNVSSLLQRCSPVFFSEGRCALIRCALVGWPVACPNKRKRASRCLGTPSGSIADTCLELTRCLVRFVSQLEEEVREMLRLADEEAVIDETLNGSDGA